MQDEWVMGMGMQGVQIRAISDWPVVVYVMISASPLW